MLGSLTSVRRRATLQTANYYVYPASAQGGFQGVNGSDSNNGTSRATPFATITKAASVVSAGQTVAIAPGNYPINGTIQISNVGSSGSPVTFRSDRLPVPLGGTGGARIIRGPSFPVYTQLMNLGTGAVGQWIILDGIEFDGQSNNKGGAFGSGDCAWAVIINGDNCTVQNCYAHDLFSSDVRGGAAIDISTAYFGGVGNTTVQRNVIARVLGPSLISGNGEKGDGIYYTGPGNVIVNNLILGCAGSGITTYHGSDNTLIANNTLIGNQDGWLQYVGGTTYNSGNCTNCTAINNISANQVYNGIEIYAFGRGNSPGLTGSSNSNNTSYGSGHLDIYQPDSTIPLANQSSSNTPTTFINNTGSEITGNYHLASTSVPAYRSGIATYNGRSAPTVDILNRPRGGFYDRGAFAYP